MSVTPAAIFHAPRRVSSWGPLKRDSLMCPDASNTSNGFEQQVELHGEKGSIKAALTVDGGPVLQAAQSDEPLQQVTIPARFWEGADASQPFFDQSVVLFTVQPIGCRLFVAGILEDRPVVPSFFEGWKAQQIIDAAIISNQRRCWVDV